MKTRTLLLAHLFFCLICIHASAQHTSLQRLYGRLIDTTKAPREKLYLIEAALIDACATDTTQFSKWCAQYNEVEKKINPAFQKYTLAEQQALLFHMRGDDQAARTIIDSLSQIVNKKELLAKKAMLDYSRAAIFFSAHDEAEHPAIETFFKSSIKLAHDQGNWMLEGSYWLVYSKYRFNERSKKEFENMQNDAFLFSDSAIAIFQRHGMTFFFEKSTISEARAYYLEKNNSKAEELILPMLSLAEKISDTTSLMTAYSLLGGIYGAVENYQEAVKYNLKGIQLAEKLKSYGYLSNYCHQVMFDYASIKDTLKALEYGRKSILYNDLAKNNYNDPLVKGDFGELLLGFGFIDSAKYYQKIALEERIKFKNKEGELYSYNSLGRISIKEKNFQEAVSYGEKALAIENDRHFGIYDDNIYLNLYQGYEGLKNWEKAFLYMKKHQLAIDSLDSLSNKTKIGDIRSAYEKKQMKEQFDFKQNISKIESEKQAQKNSFIRNLLLFGILSILLILVFVFRSYRIKNKSNILLEQKNTEIAMQKEIVEEKQKEIIDSIHYAKRIQQSLLPTEKYIEKTLIRLNKNKNNKTF